MKKKTKNQQLALAQKARLRREGCTNFNIVIKKELTDEFADFRKMRRLRREFPWAARDCMEEAINDWLNKQAKEMDITRPNWIDIDTPATPDTP